MKKKMLMLTGLPVWSIRKGVGAPSFYKTIELYNNNNWDVNLWTTEKRPDICELSNVHIKHIPICIPLIKIPVFYNFTRNIRFIVNQLLIILLYIFNFKKFDIIYAYEVEFVPGAKFLSNLTKTPFISRFQGTILYPLMKKKFWKIRYLPHVWALSVHSDITIMTDDGTQGDKVINSLRKNKSCNIWFVKNGVDEYEANLENVSDNIKKLIESHQNHVLFLSVSRLQSWKRVDRSIDIFKKIHEKTPNCFYIIGGDGSKKVEWKSYSVEHGLSDSVHFVGGINKDEVYFLQNKATFFLSTYELSNMGNPLFEAMRNGCIVVTVNNGTTGELIKDFENGIISQETEYINNSEKVLKVMQDTNIERNIKIRAQNSFQSNFRKWDERMYDELKRIEGLL